VQNLEYFIREYGLKHEVLHFILEIYGLNPQLISSEKITSMLDQVRSFLNSLLQGKSKEQIIENIRSYYKEDESFSSRLRYMFRNQAISATDLDASNNLESETLNTGELPTIARAFRVMDGETLLKKDIVHWLLLESDLLLRRMNSSALFNAVLLELEKSGLDFEAHVVEYPFMADFVVRKAGEKPCALFVSSFLTPRSETPPRWSTGSSAPHAPGTCTTSSTSARSGTAPSRSANESSNSRRSLRCSAYSTE
jgi:hypothetical protein